jgi:hypothetical protein
MKTTWKIATAAVVAAAIATAPMAGAAPGKGHGKSGSAPGKTISAIAKGGGGAAGVLGALVTLKPTNVGLQNALSKVTATKTPDPTPDPTTEPAS